MDNYSADEEMPLPISLDDINAINANYVTVLHITSPEVALKIAREREVLASSNPNDMGLNCYFIKDGKLDGHDGYDNQAAAYGAKVYFEWRGKVLIDPTWTQSTPNILWDMRKWRGFIPASTDVSLYLSEIELEQNKGWFDQVEVPKISLKGFLRWLRYRLNPHAHYVKAIALIEDDIYRARNMPIKVVQGT